VINARLRVIETRARHKEQDGKVYAGRNGIIGALTRRPEDQARGGLGDRAAALPASGAFGLMPLKSPVARDDTKREYERRSEVSRRTTSATSSQRRRDFGDTCFKVSRSEDDGLPAAAINVPKRSTQTCRYRLLPVALARWRSTWPCDARRRF